MKPARLQLDIGTVDLNLLLETVNTPTAGPAVTAHTDRGLVVFECATWRPILEARLTDALEQLAGG